MSSTTTPMIALSAIIIGSTNPRKAFDEDAIKELAESIKAKGVIQPILVRPTKQDGSYELVCGERRYRASHLAGKTEIPVYVRELNDEEALEAQITENLQRKDVHPMEEAFAFKQLLGKHSVEEVAARFGKKDYFINQRMKLNDLTPEWQKLFYNHFFNLSTALKIAILPEASQKEMLKDSGVNGKDVEKTKTISINSYRLNQYSGDLCKAPFSLSDSTLDKKMGACSGCQFNSAVANLFPDSVKTPVCSNISCFKHKCDIGFDRELAKALEDPTIVFITPNYGINDDKIKARLAKENQNILTRYNYNEVGVQKADIMGYAEWREDEDDDTDESELKTAYEEYLQSENKLLEQVEKKIASGKYLKAFVVEGTGKGNYKYIELQKQSQSSSKGDKKTARERVESGKGTAEDIETELTRLRDNEKRAKELDAEKVHKLIVDAMKQDKTLKALPPKFTTVDRVLMCFLLCEYSDYNSREQIKKIVGFNWSDKGDKLFKQLEGITDAQLAFVVRTFIFQKYYTNLPHGNGGYMVRKLAELLGTIAIEAIETEQKERADKRQKKVQARIVQLQEQKKLLKPQEKKAAKPSTKKAVKK